MTTTMSSLLNCNNGWKQHTADLTLTSIASRSSQTLSQESFTRKWWLSFEAETWKFTKNKLLKLVNSRKADFLFAGLNLNRSVQKKKHQKMSHFMDDALKQVALCYIFKCWDLIVVCPPLSKFLATRLVPGWQLCDLNFDNHVHGNAQFLGQSDIKHM